MTETNENVAATVSVKMETFVSHFLKYSYYKNGKCLYDFNVPFYIFMFIFLLLLVFVIVSQIGFFFF